MYHCYMEVHGYQPLELLHYIQLKTLPILPEGAKYNIFMLY